MIGTLWGSASQQMSYIMLHSTKKSRNMTGLYVLRTKISFLK
jgi:hypothetical protein